jgi:hypothetical protein
MSCDLAAVASSEARGGCGDLLILRGLLGDLGSQIYVFVSALGFRDQGDFRGRGWEGERRRGWKCRTYYAVRLGPPRREGGRTHP